MGAHGQGPRAGPQRRGREGEGLHHGSPSSYLIPRAALKLVPTLARSQGARKLLERATQSLPGRKHIKLLTRAALSEFRLGSAERGRGILEGVLRNYPKRLDLWNVYIDQEIKVRKGIYHMLNAVIGKLPYAKRGQGYVCVCACCCPI